MWSLSYTSLSLVLIVDQLLLPMFHFGSVSFKISYLILGFWLVNWLSNTSYVDRERRDITRVLSVFSIIIFCSLLGELWLASKYNIQSYSDTTKNVITYLLAAFAFGLGRSSRRFRIEWLIQVLYAAVALNLSFIIFKNDLPSWIISFYYPEAAVSDAIGFQSVADIIALLRPRGLFGNPNASMLMVNIIVLAICIALRKKVIAIRSLISGAVLISLPVILAALLASRAEFVVACVLGYLNYQALKSSYGRLLKKLLPVIIISMFAAGTIFTDKLGESFSFNVERAFSVSQTFQISDETQASIARPLMTLGVFIARFLSSPIFGSGISPAESPDFSEGTQYYHNDWFYILSTSGVIGFFSLIWLLFHLLKRLGWPVIIPFILPGFVNTFVLNVPAFIAYFGMVGILLTSVDLRSMSRANERRY